MKTILFSILFCSITFFSNSQTVYYDYQDGIVVFQLKTDVDYFIPTRGKQVDISRVDFINALKEQYKIYEMTQLHPNDPDVLLRNTYQVKFENWAQVDDLIAAIKRESVIDYAERKELHRTFLTPNDLGPNASTGTGMWHLYKMNAQLAWDLSTGNSNVVVAVTDDAILMTHEDLQNKLVQGYDAPTGGTNTNPCGSNNGNHGTHVSGTVGAETNNNIGVSSIGYNVSVMPVKIGNCNGALTHGYEGINYAANNGADVINMSWGGGGFSNYGQNICNAAFNAGAILVAAAGNDGNSQQFYPAAYNNVISVASTTTSDAKSSFSQYGTWIDISAPGSAIRSTYATSNSGYARIQGTSMASPNVAGLVGLIKSYVPTASNQDIINCLLSSADNIDAANGNYIGQLGAGRINAYAALQCIGAFNVTLDCGIVEVTSPETTICGNSFTPEVTLRNFGTTTLTSATITYDWNGTPSTFNWTGNLPQGQTEVITLPTQTATTGSYTFSASSSNPNGGTDLNTSNDQTDKNFSIDVNGQIVDINLLLDCYGSEITWTLSDDNGTQLYSGGGYADNASGLTVVESFCLPVGCYVFDINDSYGDGMYGSQWQNCSIDGDYFIIDETGDTLVQMTAPNADFGSGTSHNFCVISPNIQNDAGVTAIISPTALNCSNSVVPEVELRNFGSNTLTSVTINYQTTGAVQTFAWTGNLLTGQTENVVLPAIVSNSGSATFTAYTSSPNAQLDDNLANDQSVSQTNVFGAASTLPFSEDFESGGFTNGGWLMENPDNDITWAVTTVGGSTPGTNAAKIDFFNYGAADQRDAMTTPLLSLVGYNTAQLTFDHAYRRFNQNAADSLIIYVSSDCGQTWNVELAAAEDGTGSFATQTTNTNSFTPAAAADWCFAGTIGASCFTVNLNAYVGQEILVKFESYNAGTIGNNLYIDNINIDGVAASVPPTPNFSADASSICEGGTVNFTDASSPNITAWNWSFPGGVPATSTQQNPTVTYATSGTYDVSLTVTNSSGTQSITNTSVVTVVGTPVVNATASSLTICEGETTQITASGANTYSWDNGLGSGATHAVTPTSTTTYTVTGSNGASCDNTQQITITVNPLPVVSASTSTSTICNGDPAQLNASGASTYAWDNGVGAGAAQTVTPAQTTTYTVTGTDANGCSDNSSVTVTVEDEPVISVSAASFEICEGESVVLTASGANAYNWTPTTGLSGGTGASITASPTATTSYTVEGTNSCGSDTEAFTITVNVGPPAPVITQTGNVLSVVLQPGQSATWTYNGVAIGNGPSANMTGNGLYGVTVTNAAGCGTTTTGNFELDVTGTDELELNMLSVYPNPSNGLFTVGFDATGTVNIWIVDAIGRRVTETMTYNEGVHEEVINLLEAPAGVYTLMFASENGLQTKRLIKK